MCIYIYIYIYSTLGRLRQERGAKRGSLGFHRLGFWKTEAEGETSVTAPAKMCHLVSTSPHEWG